MLRDHDGRGTVRLEQLGHPGVRLCAPGPGDLTVERIADQGVPERHAVGSQLHHQAAAQQFVGPPPDTGHLGDHGWRELLTGDRRGHRGGPGVRGQWGRLKEDRVAHAVRQRQVLAVD